MQALNGRLVLSPSDLNDYVECPHLTTLALEVARGDRASARTSPTSTATSSAARARSTRPPTWTRCAPQGRQVVDVIGADRWDFDGSARATIEAMRAGAEVIYQATFVDGRLARPRGLPRARRAADGAGRLGLRGARREARARREAHLRAAALLLQRGDRGHPGRRRRSTMHVLLGIGERRTLRHDDFAAYYRRVRAGFLAAHRPGARPTEPYRVEHCGLCEFRAVCDERWEREDHLVLVAGIRREQVTRLRVGRACRRWRSSRRRAGRAVDQRRRRTRSRRCATRRRCSSTGGRPGDLDWHALPVEAERGFERLPRPSTGDVIFDIEGDPFWEPARGLHFLFGLLTARRTTDWRYRAIWAHDRAGERRRSRRCVDLFHERLAARSRHARLPLRRLRADGAQAAHGRVRDARGRGGRAAAARGLRRPAHGRAPGAAGRRVELLAEGGRGAAGLPRARRDVTQRHARGAGLRAVDADAGRGARSTRSPPTTRRTAGRRSRCATGCVEHRPRGDELGRARRAARPVDDDRQKTDARARGAAAGAARRAASPDRRAGSPAELLEYHRREARPAWWWFFAALRR